MGSCQGSPTNAPHLRWPHPHESEGPEAGHILSFADLWPCLSSGSSPAVPVFMQPAQHHGGSRHCPWPTCLPAGVQNPLRPPSWHPTAHPVRIPTSNSPATKAEPLYSWLPVDSSGCLDKVRLSRPFPRAPTDAKILVHNLLPGCILVSLKRHTRRHGPAGFRVEGLGFELYASSPVWPSPGIGLVILQPNHALALAQLRWSLHSRQLTHTP